MTTRPGPVLLAALAAGLVLGSQPAFGKRAPPRAVAPVVHEGVRYEAPHFSFSNPCGQNGGCIVASDAASGAPLWNLKVYCTNYDPGLETDVQDVFITSIMLDQGRLTLTNERNLRFAIDLGTRSVTGDARGCEDAMGGGCAYAPSSMPTSLLAWSWVLAALVLARRRRS
jgi:hypothetical protein